VLQHLELLDGFVGEVLEQAADDVVLVVAAIHVDVELPPVAAVHRHVAGTGLRRVEVAGGAGLRHDDREVGERAVEQRQVRDLARRDHPPDIGPRRLDERRFAGDDDRLRDTADLEREPQRLPGAKADDDVLSDRALEVGQFGRHGVAARGEQREAVFTRGVGRRGLGEPGVLVANGDADTREYCAPSIDDAPDDFSGRGLRVSVAHGAGAEHGSDRASDDQYTSETTHNDTSPSKPTIGPARLRQSARRTVEEDATPTSRRIQR
jgi:hypothetical protein